MIEGKDLDREREFLKSQQEQCSDKKAKMIVKQCPLCKAELAIPQTEILFGIKYFCANGTCKGYWEYKE